jgi:tetratricopeptide (TPR) repeat protein
VDGSGVERSRLAFAISKYALTCFLEYWWNWTDSPEDALKETMKAAQRAIAANPNEPWAHYALASVYMIQKKHDQAIPALRKAMS